MDRREKILTDLYNSKEFKEALEKMNPPEFREDLRQELFLVLCEMNAEKLFLLHNRKELKYYAVRILINLIQSKTSSFYYKYRKHLENTFELGPNMDNLTDESICEETYAKILNTIKGKMERLSWYDQNLFNLYLEKEKNAALISRETGIPKRSIYYAIKTIKRKVRA